MNVSKYKKQYYLPPETCMDWAKKDYIDKAPAWCSVDLRDGNQALVIPMSLEQKVEFFKLLVQIGFKEIEVGFPAASETEYTFLRTLIDRKLIPEDVTIQVLTQAREHIIRKTFEAVKGAPKAIVHVYNSTSVAQREQVFKKSKEEILKIAVEGAKLLKELASAHKTLELTESGKLYYEMFEKCRREFEETKRKSELIQRENTDITTLKFGYVRGWSITGFYPLMLDALQEEFPYLNVDLESHSYERLYDLLYSGNLDFILTMHFPEMEKVHSDLEVMEICQVPQAVIYPKEFGTKKDIADFQDSVFYLSADAPRS